MHLLLQVLTLINGDRISMPTQVRLLFEVSDLAQASPATVSRAGMVYFDPSDLSWEPAFHSWVEKFIAANRHADVKALGDKWIPRCLKVPRAFVGGSVVRSTDGPLLLVACPLTSSLFFSSMHLLVRWAGMHATCSMHALMRAYGHAP